VRLALAGGRFLEPEVYARVLFEAERLAEVGIAQDAPEPIEHRARRLLVIRYDPIHPAQCKRAERVVAVLHRALDVRPIEHLAEAGDRQVVGKPAGRLAVGPEQVLDVGEGLFDDTIVLHGRGALLTERAFLPTMVSIVKREQRDAPSSPASGVWLELLGFGFLLCS
jgi:hypothetical protein